MLYVSSEAQRNCQDDGFNFAGIVDNSNPAHPRLISIFPPPVPPANGRTRISATRAGASARTTSTRKSTIRDRAARQTHHVAYFNAGLRIFDVSDAHLPTDIGSFIPPERPNLPTQTGAACVGDQLVRDSAFARRELAVTLLEVRAGSPPSAVEMIARFHRISGFEKLEGLRGNRGKAGSPTSSGQPTPRLGLWPCSARRARTAPGLLPPVPCWMRHR